MTTEGGAGWLKVVQVEGVGCRVATVGATELLGRVPRALRSSGRRCLVLLFLSYLLLIERRARLLLSGLGFGVWKREFKLPWREAGPPNHLDDKVDSDQ